MRGCQLQAIRFKLSQFSLRNQRVGSRTQHGIAWRKRLSTRIKSATCLPVKWSVVTQSICASSSTSALMHTGSSGKREQHALENSSETMQIGSPRSYRRHRSSQGQNNRPVPYRLPHLLVAHTMGNSKERGKKLLLAAHQRPRQHATIAVADT